MMNQTMNDETVSRLLARFYAGEATPEEETQLQAYFLQPQVSSRFEADRQLFSSLYGLREGFPTGMKERLERQIDSWNQIERHTSRHARVISLRWIGGIAASLLVLFAVGWMVYAPEKEPQMAWQQDTYNDPKAAYQETEKALRLFSSSIHKGFKAVKKVEDKQQ